MKPPELVKTSRLILRPPTLDDADDIFNKYAQDPKVTRYLPWPVNESINNTREFLTRCVQCWEEGNSFPWAITLKSDNNLLGMIEMRISGFMAELGFVIAKQYWNQGYMTEAVDALTRWALAQENIYRVWAACDLDNIGSTKVLEKAGMQREGILRRYSIHPVLSPEPRDCYCYSIVK